MDNKDLVVIPLVAHDNMMNRQQKTFTIVIVVLSIIIALLVGYIIYDRWMGVNSKTVSVAQQSDHESQNNSYIGADGGVSFGGDIDH
jgi:flagellar basal body-associated protein FliL